MMISVKKLSKHEISFIHLPFLPVINRTFTLIRKKMNKHLKLEKTADHVLVPFNNVERYLYKLNYWLLDMHMYWLMLLVLLVEWEKKKIGRLVMDCNTFIGSSIHFIEEGIIHCIYQISSITIISKEIMKNRHSHHNMLLLKLVWSK